METRRRTDRAEEIETGIVHEVIPLWWVPFGTRGLRCGGELNRSSLRRFRPTRRRKITCPECVAMEEAAEQRVAELEVRDETE